MHHGLLLAFACLQASSDRQPPISYGLEIAFRSGHADRGFIINDRPVVQPVTWASAGGVELSLWSSFALIETTDGTRPRIVEGELTGEQQLGKLTLAPAVRMFSYHDPLSTYSTYSIEGWLYVSYHAGPLRLFSNHSLDLQTYRGAYFGEAGIASEGRVADRVEIGGSFAAGWASRQFNAAYAEVAKSALDRFSVEGWLTAHVTPHLYISPHVEFSTILDQRVRAGVLRPTYFLFRLSTGSEF